MLEPYDESKTISENRRTEETLNFSWQNISADEFWSVDGVPLNQFAYAVTTIGGSPRGFPTLSGSEPVYPGRVGQEFRPKSVQARTITLDMYVNGYRTDGETQAQDQDSELWFNHNWESLQRLFWTPDNQIELTRRWRVIARDRHTGEILYNDDGSYKQEVIKATAMAQISGAMEPQMTGRNRATFSVDLLLSDPYFYGDTRVVSLNLDLPSFTLWNNGTAPTTGTGCYLQAKGPYVEDVLSLVFRFSSEWSVSSRVTVGANPAFSPKHHWMECGVPGLSGADNLTFYFDKSVAIAGGIISTQVEIDSLTNRVLMTNNFSDQDSIFFKEIGNQIELEPYPVIYQVVGASSSADSVAIKPYGASDSALVTFSSSSTAEVHRPTYPVTGLVSSQGSEQWIVLQPGLNTLTLSEAELPDNLFASPLTLGSEMIFCYREPYV